MLCTSDLDFQCSGIPLPKLHHLSEYTPQRMQRKFIQEINLATQGINYLPPPPNTCTKKRCFEWFLSPEERQCCTFAEQIHLPHACISARAIHVISLQNSKHVTSTKKTSCKTLRGDEISSRLFTCSHSHTLYRISSSPEMLL